MNDFTDWDKYKDYMDDIRDKALEKLDKLERAAIFEDIKEFIFEYQRKCEKEYAESYFD